MILALLLAAQAAAAPVAEASLAPIDIVVTAQRLKRLRLVTRRDPATGAVTCVFKRRSGYLALDDLVCRATLVCVPKVNTMAEMRACMAPTLDALVAHGVRWQANAP